MKKWVLVLAVLMAMTVPAVAAEMSRETVTFEPVRAPSKGPADAPVTIIEIADFM